MLAYALILILLLPVTFLAATVANFFSPEELTEIGIRLQSGEMEETLAIH